MDAFELGARAVNPKATTREIFTNNWCDPGKQVEAVNALRTLSVAMDAASIDCAGQPVVGCAGPTLTVSAPVANRHHPGR